MLRVPGEWRFWLEPGTWFQCLPENAQGVVPLAELVFSPVVWTITNLRSDRARGTVVAHKNLAQVGIRVVKQGLCQIVTRCNAEVSAPEGWLSG